MLGPVHEILGTPHLASAGASASLGEPSLVSPVQRAFAGVHQDRHTGRRRGTTCLPVKSQRRPANAAVRSADGEFRPDRERVIPAAKRSLGRAHLGVALGRERKLRLRAGGRLGDRGALACRERQHQLCNRTSDSDALGRRDDCKVGPTACASGTAVAARSRCIAVRQSGEAPWAPANQFAPC